MYYRPLKDRDRVEWIVATTAAALLMQLLISWKLWLPFGREFPMVSAFAWLPLRLGVAGDVALFALLVAVLAGLLLNPTSRRFLFSAVGISALFVLEDITRLQPWLFLDALLFTTAAFFPPGEGRNRAAPTVALILIGTYFWSGIGKFNVAFTQEVFPWMVEPAGLLDAALGFPALALIVPLAEVAIAAGLMIYPFRKPAVAVAVFLHLYILFALSPLGHNWNVVIWPWNIQMAAILLILFPLFRSPTRGFPRGAVRAAARTPVFQGALFLTLVAPALFFFGLWDSHLSGSLYSGNNREVIFYYPTTEGTALPESSRLYRFEVPGTGEEFLMIDHWGLGELEAPPYPEERYFRRIGKELCGCLNESAGAGIRITVKAPITSAQHLEEIPCDELLR